MSFIPLVAALVWTAALVADSHPFGPVGALLTGVGLLSMAAVAVVGMTVTGGRWAHRLGLASVAAGVTIAVVRPIDAFWLAGLGGSAVAGAALFTPQVTSRFRKLPAATGPPGAAVVATLLLISTPFLIGVTLDETATWPALLVGLSAPLVAFAFSRVLPGGLIALRVAWPLAALAAAPLLGVPAGVVAAGLAIGVAVFSWRPEVRTSFHPPTEDGSAHPIPPELVPGEILDAADIDDHGRRR